MLTSDRLSIGQKVWLVLRDREDTGWFSVRRTITSIVEKEGYDMVVSDDVEASIDRVFETAGEAYIWISKH